MTNTINNVPRELLERVIMSTYMYWPDAPLIKEIRALLSAPSPAGVDGLEVVGYSYGNGILINDTTQPDNPMYTKLVRLSAAQAIIDGLRGELAVALKVPSVAAMHTYLDTECAKDNIRLGAERDQQAQRIGELEGLLLRVQVSLSLDDTEWGYSGAEKYKLLADIRAALSAGKDSDQ